MLELGSTTVAGRPTRRLRRDVDEQTEVDESSLSTAELAECTCPEYCERDHQTD